MSGGDPYGKVQAGSKLRIPARAWNGLMEMLKWWRGSGRKGAAVGHRGLGAGVILVKNSTGSALDEYAVVSLGAPLISPDDNDRQFVSRVAVVGSTPAFPASVGKFGVLQEPLAVNAIGRCMVSGATPVTLEHVHDSHKCADIMDGDFSGLKSCQLGGARILWSPGAPSSSSGSSGSSEGLAYVVLGDNLGEFGLWARITSKTPSNDEQDSSGPSSSSSSGGAEETKWTYGFAEVYKKELGYGGWRLVPGGITGDCRNGIEDINDSYGMQGNGVDLELYPGKLLPLAIGDIVWLKLVDVGGTAEWWFSLVNEYIQFELGSSSGGSI